MANRTNPIHDASRRSQWALLEVGRELRIARIRAGMTQSRVAELVGRSASRISRMEAGNVPGVSVGELLRTAAAVGLKLYVNAYPAGRRPLDAPQLALINAFNARLHPSWRREPEKVVPLPGDLRAADELISIESCSAAVEAITRFADVQAQVRSSRLKQRDLGADRLILLVRGSNANRRMLREAGDIVRENFPIATREALRALAAGEDPGDDCLIVM